MSRRLFFASLFIGLLPSSILAQNLNEEFWAAAKKGDVAALKTLLDKGVDVNAKTQYGATALSYACDKGHVEVVKLLLERGADVNSRDTFYGEVPLGWALMRNHVEVIKVLLDKGAQGTDRALMQSVQSGNAEIVKVALAKGGLSPETLSRALSTAKRLNRTEIAELLTKAGATEVTNPGVQVDPAILKTYVGVYKNDDAGELTIEFRDGKLMGKLGAQPWFSTAAVDNTNFTVVEVDGISIKFNVEGDKVVSFTLKQGGFTGEFKRQ
jgi:hypothetical protein